MLSPNVFRSGKTLIVLRHNAGYGALPDHERLIYVVDDDFRACLKDRELPFGYRQKTRLIEARMATALEAAADVIVAASETLRKRLAERHPQKDIVVLHPAWPVSAAPLPRDRPESLAFLSARSHAADLAFLAPVLADCLERHGQLRLTVSGNLSVPPELARNPKVEVLPPLDWEAYRRWMQDKHFDVGLYPLSPGDFNAARSLNKIGEYDQFGAAVLVSDHWSAADTPARAGRVLQVPHDPVAWSDAIEWVVSNSGIAKKIAAQNRAHLQLFRERQLQRAFWIDHTR